MTLKKLVAIPALGLILAGAGCNASYKGTTDVPSDTSSSIEAEIKAIDAGIGSVDAEGYSSTGLDDSN